MTQQTKMPEPVAYLSCNTQTGQPEWSEDCVCQDNVYSVMETGTIGRPVIFADQAEAYKDACVREALEEAINLSSMYGATIEPDAAIRALIPK
ncbi:MAG: hypothetical protein WBF88_17650 [Pusillimonas sp.]